MGVFVAVFVAVFVDVAVWVAVRGYEPKGLTKCDFGNNVEGEESHGLRDVHGSQVGVGRDVLSLNQVEELQQSFVDVLLDMLVLLSRILELDWSAIALIARHTSDVRLATCDS